MVNVSSPAMLPYMGRPLIYQTIVNHIRHHSADVMVAVPHADTTLQDFLVSTFGARVNLTLVPIHASRRGTPATSLGAAVAAAIERNMGERPAYIVHGDTYFEPAAPLKHERPVIYVDDYVSSDKYSYLVEDGTGYRHHGAQPDAAEDAGGPGAGRRFTDIGAYWVPSLGDVAGAGADEAGDGKVGEVLTQRYAGQVELAQVKVWSDLGHLDTATQIRTRLIGARAFNKLVVDEDRGLITKSSQATRKIVNEVGYYQNLPHPLSIYFPRLFDFSLSTPASYTMEYYSYRTLAEYFVFFRFPLSVWKKLINKLIAIQREFARYQGPSPTTIQVEGFYLGKLHSRMGELDPESAIGELVRSDFVGLNGQSIQGWRHYLPLMEATVKRIASAPRTSIIHGDLCFSNILYDPQTGLLRLIDPRGDFYEKGCFGDPRYDLAKLLHSVHGGYDFIMQEMYDLQEETPGDYRLKLFRPDGATAMVQSLMTDLGEQLPYQMDDLITLEAMLFLSMLPLHSDDERRQKAMYLTGIGILNEVFGADLR